MGSDEKRQTKLGLDLLQWHLIKTVPRMEVGRASQVVGKRNMVAKHEKVWSFETNSAHIKCEQKCRRLYATLNNILTEFMWDLVKKFSNGGADG